MVKAWIMTMASRCKCLLGAIFGWLSVHLEKILLSFGIVFVVGLACAAGFLLGREQRLQPMIVQIPGSCERTDVPSDVTKSNEHVEANQQSDIPIAENQERAADNVREDASTPRESSGSCVFVGSRNSDKYHLPTCTWAKRIKLENRVCFSSAADAESKGYKPGCIR